MLQVRPSRFDGLAVRFERAGVAQTIAEHSIRVVYDEFLLGNHPSAALAIGTPEAHPGGPHKNVSFKVHFVISGSPASKLASHKLCEGNREP